MEKYITHSNYYLFAAECSLMTVRRKVLTTKESGYLKYFFSKFYLIIVTIILGKKGRFGLRGKEVNMALLSSPSFSKKLIDFKVIICSHFHNCSSWTMIIEYL